jgi:hypothetical protein
MNQTKRKTELILLAQVCVLPKACDERGKQNSDLEA